MSIGGVALVASAALVVVVVLLVVLVVQASIARITLQEIEGGRRLRASENECEESERAVKSYGIVVDVATSSALRLKGLPTSQTALVPCESKSAAGVLSVQPATHSGGWWMVANASPATTRLSRDVGDAGEGVTTIVVANVAMRVWRAAAWPHPSVAQPPGSALFSLALPAKAQMDSASWTALTVRDPLGTTYSSADTHTFISALADSTQGSAPIPVRLWGY